MLAREVSIDQYGFVVMPVDIKHRHSPIMKSVSYKIDTGANCTTINHERLSELGYDEAWIRKGRLLIDAERPTLASGVSVNDCYRVILPEIR